jgi:hypothetical protein
VRLVSLSVKPAYAIALYARLPSVLSRPLEASVTLLEATTPVKLPAMHCLPRGVRQQAREGWYFTAGSPIPGDTGSQPPTYPTHPWPVVNAKL